MSKAFKEHDYIGLSEVSSIEQTSNKPKSIPIKTSNFSNKTIKDLNFKATELRLGLPGSESPVRVLLDDDISVNCPLGLVTNLVSGTKRGFSYAINGDYCNWVLPKNGECLKNGVSISSPVLENDDKLQSSPVSEQGMASHGLSKTQVVGWPPIRSFRRNSMAVNTTKTNNEKDFYLESGCLFIKVSMDGAPYLRKVDLKIYGSYMELSLALEKMFSGFTIGQHCDKEMPGQNKLTRGRLMDDHHPSEYFLTYEDKDGDWMLVGDVPWNMFMDSCRRLRIMKSTEAVGLASRATWEQLAIP